ncbi:hypothetical protein [Caldicellulosiruptor acetigenus]|uniref:hypothetical protein n=1 Tax=Caldicellulosiruptor acetigenus TaxID=301953 RepID=UPI0004922883|nr:hypothetical protein [Caldicellulosiruptor acetigenus]WAM37547.1 hypothetical protein OTK01_001716 [Caldicellulosiruptor acetigenus]
MKKNLKRIVAIVVCLSFILTLLPINSVSFAKPRYDVWKDKIKVYDVDKKIKRAEAEYEGYKYIATFDKDTNEIKLKVKPLNTKKFDKSLDNSSLNEEKNFSVKVEYFDGENLKAKLIDEKTNEEYNIGDSDTVTAQFAIALPIAVELLEALISALLAISEAIVIVGVTYIVASRVLEKIKNSSYDYYMAIIRNDNVYIGPAIDYEIAYNRVSLFEGDVFCRTESKAKTLALNVAYSKRGIIIGPERHNNYANYYPHYHVKDAYGYKLASHIFFPY